MRASVAALNAAHAAFVEHQPTNIAPSSLNAAVDAAASIIEAEIVAKVVKGEYPVAYETIRADVIREVVGYLDRISDVNQAGAEAPIRMVRGMIEREFGGDA